MTAPDDFRISVIVTSYNNERYLAATLDSILAQTWRPHEIIVTDDCSQDSSPDIIRRYTAQHPGWVKGLFQPENLFIPRNRNAALATVTGNYVAIVDGDDRYLPHNLATQVAALRAHPQAGVAYSNVYYIDPHGNRFRIRDQERLPSGDLFVPIAGLEMGFLRSMVIRYDLMQAVGFLNPDFPHHDGYMLCLELARRTEFAYVFEPLAEYRVHPHSTSKMPHRVKLGFLAAVAAEVQRQTRHLPAGQRAYVDARWAWKLREQTVKALVQEGKRPQALATAAGGLLRRPRQVVPTLGLLKKVWSRRL